MTQFEQSSRSREDDTPPPSGQEFLQQCKERLQEAVAECVAAYDGQSVEDFADDIVTAVWDVEAQDLRASFVNGKKLQAGKRRARRSR